MTNEITLFNASDHSTVKISMGELMSFQKFGEEFIHQKGDKGWAYSDTEMFPVIGPTKRNDYTVLTPQGIGIQDQHGMLRILDYILLESTENTAVYEKKYKKNTPVKNPKSLNKSRAEEVLWPYDFSFIKRFKLQEGVLKIQFEMLSSEGMPFMLGYHPAFKISKSSTVNTDRDEKITIENVLDAGADAYPILNANKISLMADNSYKIDILTEGFNNFMLWTEVENMLCIEPITQYPDLENQKYTENNMRISGGKEMFSVSINPIGL